MSLVASATATRVDDVIRQLFDQYIQIHPINNEYLLASPDGSTKSHIQQWFNLRNLPIVGRFIPEIDDKTKLINELLEYQKTTTTYREWYTISLRLDELLGNNAWKSDPQSDIYDYNLIYKHLNAMKQARLDNNYKLLLYYIRTTWVRNLGNMGDSNLYRHSYVGTKKLIEEYIQECQVSLNYLVEEHNDHIDLDDRYLLGMLIQTRKNIGRTALVLSGGSTFGIFHIGVLATLFEANLLPRIISGSSAGSIMASIICSHTNEETIELLQTIAQREFNIFDITDKVESASKFKKVLLFLGHWIKYGTVYDIEGLQETMIGFLGELTFREAYNRTGKILNITVSPASIHEQTRLLNYITAPNCLIWSAVCASCSLPGVFPSSSVYEKNPKTNEIHEWNNDESMKFMDGSVDNDLPITRLSEMFNVDHIIAVQVNPHVVPVLKVSISSVGGDVENELSFKLKQSLNNVYDFVVSEAIHYLQLLNEMDIYKNLANKTVSLLSQRYSGDITILPEYKWQDFTKILRNPSHDFLLEFICRGAKASWPKMSLIENHCRVEFALDKAISILRGRIVTSGNYRLTNSPTAMTSGTVKSNAKANGNANGSSMVISLGSQGNGSSTRVGADADVDTDRDADIDIDMDTDTDADASVATTPLATATRTPPRVLKSSEERQIRQGIRKSKSSNLINSVRYHREKNGDGTNSSGNSNGGGYTHEERANLPSRSRSLKNSYIGLNRLNDDD
ncbi:patatin-like phospholipase [Candida orthopsilosis Co 90-125]|uniref:Patatin-like phospholipase domain-containing protein n=1 Tax=Candida orthopsilosis (strain 90-125) TaxID=1136231 RepID=H8X5N0_CANO9|nr:patatin-like phospholipase [Candida orthopsilosis Co 90-125]CCG23488.1 patatin-like phospholipase [Candida orthopsilosis Co 90-125]